MIDFKQKTLPNGIRLVTCPIKSTEAVTILVLVLTGGRYETADKLGISHFLEHLFFKGTKKYPSAQKLSEALDAMGADFNAYTSEESTGFYVHSSAADFDKSLDILSDMYLNPLLPSSEIEKEKSVIIEEANMRRDIPQLHVQVLAQKQMFPDSPLGLDLIGTPETVKDITKADIANYFKTGYTGASTIIAVCGNPKGQDWEKKISARFKAKEQGLKPEFEMVSTSTVKEQITPEIRKVDQAHLILSAQLFKKTDQRRYQASILRTILGGGMSSRLFREVREKRGLGYYIKTDTDWYADTGLFTVSAGVKTACIEEATRAILGEIKDLQKNGPTKSELKRAKSQLRGQIALSLEGSQELASYLAEETQFEDIIRQPEDILSQIDKVTIDDIKKLTRDVFVSAKIGLAVIAPKVDAVGLTKLIKNGS